MDVTRKCVNDDEEISFSTFRIHDFSSEEKAKDFSVLGKVLNIVRANKNL
jgi:hypothetical protein